MGNTTHAPRTQFANRHAHAIRAAASAPARLLADSASGHNIRLSINESYGITKAKDGPALRVDEEAGIIFDVKVLGRFSPNCHGVQGVTEGTEYTLEAMQDALPLYEGAKIYCDHSRKSSDRSVTESLGVLRNCRVADDGIRADLHYNRRHEMAPRVVEDVQRAMGNYGLSHNAEATASVVKSGKFIVQKIGSVRSVDLVDQPATNCNLWEGRSVPKKVSTTLRKLVEQVGYKGSREKWAKKLLEADSAVSDAPMEMEVPDTDAGDAGTPEDAMSEGFRSGLYSLIDQIIDGDLEMGEGLKKIKDMIVAHDKLTGKSEPADPVPEEDGADSKDGKDSVTKESIAAIVKDAVATAIKESAAQSRPTITRVKSSAPGATQTQENVAPKSADDFVRMVRS